MMRELKKLSPSEAELTLRAPLLICILISGADDNIDRSEIKKAIEQTHQNEGMQKSRLTDFYHVVAEDFEDKLKVLIQSFPTKAAKREPLIIEELRNLNTVLSKIDRQLARELHQSLLDLARITAESSGGILGFNSVGDEEARLVNLPMIKVS